MQSFLKGLAWVGVILGAIMLLVYLFVFDTWLVPGDDPMLAVSVLPTLAPEDRILVQRGATPTFGQLARCVSPENPSKYVVGRVFGNGGDTVEIRQEGITTSGKRVAARHGCPSMRLVHPSTGQEMTLACGVEENPAWTYQALHATDLLEGDHVMRVDEGKLYIVSDNRHMHQDSRDFGAIDMNKCEHIVYRLWGKSYVDSSRRNNILW